MRLFILFSLIKNVNKQTHNFYTIALVLMRKISGYRLKDVFPSAFYLQKQSPYYICQESGR